MKRLLLTLFLLASLCNTAESNDFYTHGSFPAPGSQATSAAMRAELDLISAGFDKLPTLSGNANKLVIVNGSGTGLTTLPGTITIPVSLTISGSYGLTWNLSNTTSLTLPTSGTLSTLAGSENLSNKTLVAPVFSGTASGTFATSGNVNSSGTFEFSGVGSTYAIGTSRATASQLIIGGSFTTPVGNVGRGLNVTTNITGATNQDVYGVSAQPTITTAGGGTHSNVESLRVVPPTITNVGGTVTTASSLRVTGAPTGATNNYAAFIEGNSRLQGHTLIGSMSDQQNNMVHIGGDWAPPGATWVSALAVRPSITAVAGQDMYGLIVLGDVTKAGSGTHATFATAEFEPMTVSGSGATITNFSTLHVTGAPTGGTNNYSVFVENGLTRLAGLRVKGLTGSATTPNNLSGTCTFSASTICNVTFAESEPDADYFVVLGCDTQCGRWGSRGTGGFLITTTSSNSGTCHWMIFR
jgi:hypothetical protein